MPVKIHFSAKSTGQVILSQDIDIIYQDEEPNTATIQVEGIRPMTHVLKVNRWQITDVSVDTAPTPIDITFTLVNTRTFSQKDTTYNVDLSGDPDAQVTITLTYVTVEADEYDVPDKWVKGPDDEQDQYKNPGQWYFDSDNNTLEIWIP